MKTWTTGGRMSDDEYDFDPWETTGTPEYNRDRWYTRSTNKHNHSTLVRVNIPRGLGGLIDRFVDSKQCSQIRTREDFVRDSIFHSLRYRTEQVFKEDAPEALTLEMWQCELDRMAAEFAAMESIIATQHQVLYQAVTTGNPVMLDQALALAEQWLGQLTGQFKEDLLTLIKRYTNPEEVARLMSDHQRTSVPANSHQLPALRP